MAFLTTRLHTRPISSSFWRWLVVVVLLASPGLAGSAQGPATAPAAVAPSLGWLGGESGSPALRSEESCNAAELKRGSLAKVGRHLAALYCNRGASASSELATLVGAGADQRVILDAAAAGDPARLAADLKALGGRSIAVYGAVVSAQFPVARLATMAALPSLRLARPASARLHTGSVTGQHRVALEVSGLVASGLDGSGVAIGVLSDSYDCLGGAAGNIASGDLPAGSSALLEEAGCASGTDEGRAMMQLVHDLVPGAGQTFHTAFGGQATFAGGIQALRANGATVIVDDVTYFAEPMFQDGIIAQAVDDVASNHNVAYFSSAGNSAANSYERAFQESATTGPFGGPLHDFDPGAGVDTRQQITVPTGTTVVILNWDQPYFSATGGAGSATDLDIHVYSGATYLFSAATDNLGGDPIEILSITNNGAPTSVSLAIEYFDGPSGPTPVPTFVKYVIMNDTTIDEYATGSGTTFGHANTNGAITVGAANYWQTPPYAVDPALLASYSSHGGVAILFDLADQPVGPLDRGKPEVVGPDGANTTFFGSDLVHGTDPDTFPNFFGTSAAAPAVAALGAMMRQSRPSILATDVESCLRRTAADMGTAGHDAASGHGWVQSEAALACANGDWGDLPEAAYPTLESSNGARHVLDGATRLGATVDRDNDGQQNATATGDDGDGSDDEDGVVFVTPLIPGRPATLQITSSGGFLSVFIDFSGDGTLDGAGEVIAADQAVAAGVTVLAVSVPAAASGVMPSRFRLTATSGEGGAQPTGTAPTGEVEDHILAVLGNEVWHDLDGDGRRDGGEPAVAGVVLELLDAAQNPVLDGASVAISAVSDGAGLYAFPGLPDGDYRLRVVPPSGYGFTLHNNASEDLDSDIAPTTGVSDTFAVSAGLVEARLDVGLTLLGADWGDLPDSFATTNGSGGATHAIVFGAFLGSSADAEVDGTPGSTASGDDATGGDEDGVVFLDPLVPLHPARIQVTASQAGFLNAWIDFNGDLSFGAGERVRADVAIPAGASIFQVAVPAGATGVMYSRFRFTTDDPAGALGAAGAWANGEVEDYALASLGNRVWNDDGAGGGGIGDGLQNGTEPGMAGATIRLRDGAGAQILDAVGAVIETISDTDGDYELPGLPPGSYRLEFELPGGASGFSPADAGDDALDSDPDIFSGQTATRVLTPGQVDDTVDAGVQAPTVALISRFAALRERHGVIVEWETASEAGTLAFELYRRSDEEGWQRISGEPVTALLGSPQGGAYRLRDATAPAGARALEYALAEIESGGGLRFYGPWTVKIGNAAEAIPGADLGAAVAHTRTNARRLALAEARDGARATAPTSIAAAGPWPVAEQAKVAVRRTGLVAVTAAELARALGRPEGQVRAAIRRQAVGLSVAGVEVAWRAAPDGRDLVFYGEHRASLYARDTIYRLDLGRQGRRMAEDSVGVPRPAAGGWFEERRDFEEDLLPAINATEESNVDFWHWQGVMAGHPTSGQASFELTLPGLVPRGEATLSVRLVGGSRSPAADEHWAEVRVNGELAGTARWDDKERLTATFELDPTWLSERTTVTVTALRDGSAGFSFFYVEGFELGYRRALEAFEERLRLVVGKSRSATVSGFGGSDLIAVEVSDPAAPRWLSGVLVEGHGSYRGTVAASRGAVVEMARRSVLTALAVSVVQPPRLAASRGADYLVVAPRELLTAAAGLADYRAGDGLTTMVVDIEEIHDEFAHSQPTPWALRDFLRHAAAEWSLAPRYVVLAGAGTFDPRDLLGHGDNLLTPVLVGTPQGLAPADGLLADLDGDGVADLALGRLPVLTPAELDAYVDKVRDFERAAGPWRRQALVLADNRDAGGDFAAASDEMAASLPRGVDAERIYLDRLSAAAARQRLLERWPAGALLVNYFGHGGTQRLAAEGLLRLADVEGLASGAQSPIVAAMTCVVGRFDVPDFDSLGESLVLRPGGGAIALWAPTGLSTTGTGRLLEQEFYGRLFAGAGTRLGDATQGALAAASGQGHAPHLLATYTLLGDPALRVDRD